MGRQAERPVAAGRTIDRRWWTARGGPAALVAGLALFASVGVLGAGPVGAAPTPATGTLTGNAVVLDAPAGFVGEVGVGVCPETTSLSSRQQGVCPLPWIAISESGGSYTLSLPAGTYEVWEFYSPGFTGGAFVGRPRTVDIAPGATDRLTVRERYQVPSTLTGGVAVLGIPPGTALNQVEVTACPTSAPAVDGNLSLLCDSTFPSGIAYTLPALSKGTWDLSVTYFSEFGPTSLTVPGVVKVRKGATVTRDLIVDYRPPTNGLLQGTVTVTGAPSGFSPPLAGVGGCPGANPGTACSSPVYTLASGPDYQLPLAPGPWTVAGFFEDGGFGGQFLSTPRSVDVTADQIQTQDFTVPYQRPATLSATVAVTGVPVGATVLASEVVACPSFVSYSGGPDVPIECVFGLGAPGQTIDMATLPPGTWTVYPGYQTLSSETIGSEGTTLTLTSGTTTSTSLSIAYSG